MFNQAHSSDTLQVMRLRISGATPCMNVNRRGTYILDTCSIQEIRSTKLSLSTKCQLNSLSLNVNIKHFMFSEVFWLKNMK